MKKILYVISLVALLPMLSGCHKEYEFEMKKNLQQAILMAMNG